MMISKALLLVFVFLVLSNAGLLSQPTICIPYGTEPVMDGHVAVDEWMDADSVIMAVSKNKNVIVKFKHDSLHLYLAFLHHLESAFRFPEIVLDINNDKSVSWLDDDWWFHVSATDCVSNGAPNDFGDCQLVQPDWEAVPNMTPGLPYTDTIEIIIPFQKVNLDLATHSAIGLAFKVTNTSSAWNYWPPEANSLNPSTWANAVFCAGNVSVDELPDQTTMQIFPNPFSSHTTLRSGYEMKNATLTIYDGFGHAIKQLTNVSGESVELDRDQLSGGLYYIQWTQENHFIAAGKIVVMD